MLKFVEDSAFYNCKNLVKIEISEESELESFPLSAFNGSIKVTIMIPSTLEKLIHPN